MLFFLIIILGLVFGSFVNVLIWRLPREESIFFPFSHCPVCSKKLNLWHNIPVVGYLILRGKCGFCNAKISIRYPINEIVIALIFGLLYLVHGLSYLFILNTVLVCSLYVVTYIDLKEYIIPNEITIFLIFFGLLTATFNPIFGDIWYKSVVYSVFGMLVGGGIIFILSIIGEKIFKQEAIGGGDIKLFAGLGSILGAKSVFPILFMSSIIGSIIGVFLMIIGRKKRRDVLPFGPFIAIASIIWMYLGENILKVLRF